MQRLSFLAGTLAAGLLAAGCASGSPVSDAPSAEPLYPSQSDPVKVEVDRQFDEEYPGIGNAALVWGADRGLDLLDVISWDIQFGRGFGINASATEYLQAGMGWWEGTSLGMRGRAWGVWKEDLTHRGLGPYYWVEYERTPVSGTQTLFDIDYKYTGWDLFENSSNKGLHHDWSEFSASLELFAVGAQAAASPVEVVDFVSGFLPYVDILEDDTRARIEQRLRSERGLGQE